MREFKMIVKYTSSMYTALLNLHSFTAEIWGFQGDTDSVLVFWVLTPCRDVIGNQCFEEPCCLLLQGEVVGVFLWDYIALISNVQIASCSCSSMKFMRDHSTISLSIVTDRRCQTGSGAHPARYPIATGGSFPGGKATGASSWPFTNI
jgi:hypothetical protein